MNQEETNTRVSAQRLFFALWPDEAALRRLEGERERLVELSLGRPAPSAKIHLTVHFLGSIDEARMGCLDELAAVIRLPAPAVRLDQVGSFRQARVAWAGCSRVDGHLAELYAELGKALEREGFAVESRPYSPHVTLARKIQRRVATTSIEPIEWTARELTLVRSETGTARYMTLARWRFDSMGE